MRERGILFSGPMVRAILAGRKTQTRQAVRESFARSDGRWTWTASSTVRGESRNFRYSWPDPDGYTFTLRGRESGVSVRCPYGRPAEHLWVREAWNTTNPTSDETLPTDVLGPEAPYFSSANGKRFKKRAVYRATSPEMHPKYGISRWRPGIHMPRWASRITLAVESIRVERARDISDADVAAEGVDAEAVEALWQGATRKRRGEAWHPNGAPAFDAMRPRDLWRAAWTLINGRASWDANPWVWVVSFRRTP